MVLLDNRWSWSLNLNGESFMAIKKKFFNFELKSTTEMNLSAFQNKYRIDFTFTYQVA